MKIRRSFVSNSSSSSFCAWGIEYGVDEFLNLIEKELDLENIQEELYDLFEDVDENIKVIHDWDTETIFIGREYETLKDSETGKEFKESTEKIIQSKFPDKELNFYFINQEITC